jgi:hypothetical protein
MLTVIIIHVLGVYIFLLGLGLGVWLVATVANHFRYEPYKPDPGHQRAEEREERWYPQGGWD